MCGIFGIIATRESAWTPRSLRAVVDRLFRLSESRGREASGIAVMRGDAIDVYKDNVAASWLIRRADYRRWFEALLTRPARGPSDRLAEPVAIIGHSRLVTNGTADRPENNQPVIADGMVAVHNGIIVNDASLWARFAPMTRSGDVDSEILLRLIQRFRSQHDSLHAATARAFREIEGSASVAAMLADTDELLLATNTGSLYLAPRLVPYTCLFASEEHILQRMARRRRWTGRSPDARIEHLHPGAGCLIRLDDLGQQGFRLDSGANRIRALTPLRAIRRTVHCVDVPIRSQSVTMVPRRTSATREADLDWISTSEAPDLRRCTRCILPETMPFITFDDYGVCTYCRSHTPIAPHGAEALAARVVPHRRTGEADCLIGLSGGRDSSFVLHYVKNVLHMRPVAYTYDWGMITDLARRNIARLCGTLGVDHIVVSANIARKRADIRKNVQGWLRRPELGMIPLFMAGDKAWLYHAQRLARQIGVSAVFMGVNLLEKTEFKTGFCGVRPRRTDTSNPLAFPKWSQLRLLSYYAKQYALNPLYINQSMWDALTAFTAFYWLPRRYINLYEYIAWNEDEIDTTLRHEYQWESAGDTRTTWRVGDGTAAFYNYIYYSVAGFTEHDTFRSNQIRAGQMDRESALARVLEENQPRPEAIRWYCDTIGLDAGATLSRIAAIPKRYPTDGARLVRHDVDAIQSQCPSPT